MLIHQRLDSVVVVVQEIGQFALAEGAIGEKLCYKF